jgi:hypothetical protein
MLENYLVHALSEKQRTEAAGKTDSVTWVRGEGVEVGLEVAAAAVMAAAVMAAAVMAAAAAMVAAVVAMATATTMRMELSAMEDEDTVRGADSAVVAV